MLMIITRYNVYEGLAREGSAGEVGEKKGY
jgi:hypothetical protein